MAELNKELRRWIKMKKFIMISLILLTLFVSSGSALAWRGYHRGNFGAFFAPPPIWVAPPPVYYRGYYSAPGYYPPEYYEPYRVWVPGRWGDRWTPSGWERVWIPGYWEYRR
jgi:hypothetical protein